MIIKNAEVFCENGAFQIKDVYINNRKIVASEREVMDRTVIDAAGCRVIPGLVDIHSHGACGHDFCDCDAEGLQEILKYQRTHGITSYCPTSMTFSRERLHNVFSTIQEMQEMEGEAHIVGVNMEGPFIAPQKKGAQNGDYIQEPNVKTFLECNAISGHMIKLVTLAPEMKGAMEFIRRLKNHVHISLGHTTANYDIALEAFQNGADHVTHLYNAMPPLNHRDSGVIGAALDAKNVYVELISDGLHVHESVVRATFQMFGSESVVLISDSMRATGLENGVYDLGGQAVYVKDGKATLQDGTLAGSVANLYDCLRKALAFGVPEADAVFAATRNPAKSIGVYSEVGSITPGKRADLLIVDREFNLKRVI